MKLPDHILALLPTVNGTTLFGRPLLSYSAAELACYLVYTEQRLQKLTDEHSEQQIEFVHELARIAQRRHA